MKSVLNQLESNEAILLMYLADELSAPDRAEVERRLSADAALREELESLRGAQDYAMSAMHALDGGHATALQGAASRRVVRAMQRWQAGRALERAAQPKNRGFRLYVPAWSYPAAAAAAIILVLGMWTWHVARHVNTGAVNDNSVAWDGTGPFPTETPAMDVSPAAEQYAKIEETLDDSASLSVMDDQVNSLGDWGVPTFPKEAVEQ
jgi:anti-sigma factor RsiW